MFGFKLDIVYNIALLLLILILVIKHVIWSCLLLEEMSIEIAHSEIVQFETGNMKLDQYRDKYAKFKKVCTFV